MPTAISDWGEAMMTSVSGGLILLFAALPRILGFVAILVVGWILAGIVAKAVAVLLRRVQFDSLAARSGFSGFVRSTGVDTDASGFLAITAKWFIRLIALVVAFDALGLPAVSGILQQFLMWLPNLVVGLVVLVIGGLAANALAGVVRGTAAQGGLSKPDLLANVARIAVWAFAIIVAVNQIGIATELVNTLFMAVVGAMALGAAIAFGLGGRDTAQQIVAKWYDSAKDAKPKLERAGEALPAQAAVVTRRDGGRPPSESKH
jgi:hypothetical protein